MNKTKFFPKASLAIVSLAMAFAISCSGDNGRDGKDGEDGMPGLNGADGANGANGKDGTNGKDGSDGEAGANGKDGSDGEDGASCVVEAKEPAAAGFDVYCDGEKIGEIINGIDGEQGETGASCDVEDSGAYFVMKCGDVEKAKWAKAMCGTKAYDPDAQACKKGILMPKCGDNIYDPDDQFCDERDNTAYKWAKIGEQTWMIEDLNDLYNWDDAVNEACPAGWKLPDNDDWDGLADDSDFVDSGSDGFWWSATSLSTSNAYSIAINNMELDASNKTLLLSVRCIEE